MQRKPPVSIRHRWKTMLIFRYAIMETLFPQIILYNLLICVELLLKVLQFFSITVILRIFHVSKQHIECTLH